MTAILQSIPSAMKTRDELEQMVLANLIGHVSGPEEEVDEPSVRDRYLVEMLAPKRQEPPPRNSMNLPQGVSEPIPLKVGRQNWTPDTEFPEVEVQVLLRKPGHFWTITLFLVN